MSVVHLKLSLLFFVGLILVQESIGATGDSWADWKPFTSPEKDASVPHKSHAKPPPAKHTGRAPTSKGHHDHDSIKDPASDELTIAEHASIVVLTLIIVVVIILLADKCKCNRTRNRGFRATLKGKNKKGKWGPPYYSEIERKVYKDAVKDEINPTKDKRQGKDLNPPKPPKPPGEEGNFSDFSNFTTSFLRCWNLIRSPPSESQVQNQPHSTNYHYRPFNIFVPKNSSVFIDDQVGYGRIRLITQDGHSCPLMKERHDQSQQPLTLTESSPVNIAPVGGSNKNQSVVPNNPRLYSTSCTNAPYNVPFVTRNHPSSTSVHFRNSNFGNNSYADIRKSMEPQYSRNHSATKQQGMSNHQQSRMSTTGFQDSTPRHVPPATPPEVKTSWTFNRPPPSRTQMSNGTSRSTGHMGRANSDEEILRGFPTRRNVGEGHVRPNPFHRNNGPYYGPMAQNPDINYINDNSTFISRNRTVIRPGFEVDQRGNSPGGSNYYFGLRL